MPHVIFKTMFCMGLISLFTFSISLIRLVLILIDCILSKLNNMATILITMNKLCLIVVPFCCWGLCHDWRTHNAFLFHR